MTKSALSCFIGDPADLSSDSLPSSRDILRFVLFEQSRLKSGNRLPSNKVVFNSVAARVVALFHSRGFDTASKRNVKRSVYL